MVLAGTLPLRQRGAGPLEPLETIGLPPKRGINHIFPVLYAPLTRPAINRILSRGVEIFKICAACVVPTIITLKHYRNSLNSTSIGDFGLASPG